MAKGLNKKTANPNRKGGGEEPQKKDPKPPDTDGWLTREETSDLLRCSLQTIKNYQASGKLNPQRVVRKDKTGHERIMLVYSPKELAGLPAKGVGPRDLVQADGERTARAYEMLREGRSLEDVVIELRVSADKADELNARWLEHTHQRHVITPAAKKALEELIGPFRDVTELVELVTSKLGAP
jgi:hypothetical protein